VKTTEAEDGDGDKELEANDERPLVKDRDARAGDLAARRIRVRKGDAVAGDMPAQEDLRVVGGDDALSVDAHREERKISIREPRLPEGIVSRRGDEDERDA